MESTATKSKPTDYSVGNETSSNRLFGLLEWLGPWRSYILGLFLNDALMAGAAFRAAYWIRFELGLPIFQLDVDPSISYYRQLVLLLVPVLLLVYAVVGLYKRSNLLGGPVEYSLVFRGSTISMLIVLVAGFIQTELIIARGWLLMAWGLIFLSSSFGRFILRRVVYRLRRHGYYLTPAVIVGANAEGFSLAEQLRNWETSGLKVMGFVDGDTVKDETEGNLPILGDKKDLDEIIEHNEIEEVIIATSALSRIDMLAIFKKYGFSSRVNLRMSSGLFEIITTGLDVKEFAYVPLVEVNKVRLTGSDRILKTMLDYSLTIPGIIIISPLLAIIGALVKLTSPGPIIYRRRVMGVNGQQFDAFKFRTMYENGDEILAEDPELQQILARDHKLKDDPRITPFGKFLRKFSLDELPQLFNVLRREMSLVGPRMISPAEMEKYDQWGLNLLTVQPGITGIWQTSGRSDTSYRERVRLDMHYIRNWTIWLDLQILWQTISAVIRGRGAY